MTIIRIKSTQNDQIAKVITKLLKGIIFGFTEWLGQLMFLGFNYQALHP